MESIGVIGAGAWGTALAQVFAKSGKNVLIWALEQEVVDSINNDHENTAYLKGAKLSDNLRATNTLDDVVGRDVILLVTPAQHVRATLEKIANKLTSDKPLIICAKGIELETGLLMSQVAEQVVPNATIGVMSGPTFASELVQGLPGGVTIGIKDEDMGKKLQEFMGIRNRFRPYISSDIIGVQLGGAIKNVIAIACGTVYGRKMGESARAALLTRGIAEIARLAVAMGAKKETFLGMCGVGDLMLTCSSMQSRNYSLGVALGEGQKLEDILKSRNAVTEGIHTAESTLALAKKNAVDMPITEAVNRCLKGETSIDKSIAEMLNRPFRYEMAKS